MKKYLIISLMAALPLLFSCAKETVAEADVQAPEAVQDPWKLTSLELGPVVRGNLKVTADIGNPTKSTLLVDGSDACVVWSPGDEFYMIGTDGSTKIGETVYTTLEGGAVASFSGGATISGATRYHSIYPDASVVHLWYSSDGWIWGITIPSVQTAVDNNIASGVNISYAQSETQEEDLHFKNALSYIKFRLTGSVLPSIKSVTFRGSDPLSGELVMGYDDAGNPEFLKAWYFEPDTRSREVRLCGTFKENTDYYIAVAPGNQEAFSMVFANADGSQTIAKNSSKVLPLSRSRIYDFGTIDLGSSFDAPDTFAELYMEHTTSQYATIAVLPDGYTSAQLGQYELDARSAIDMLFSTEPYKSYKEYFNVWILKVASKESGGRIEDGTAAEQNRNCFFQSSWGAESYNTMRANDFRVFSFVMDYCPDVRDGIHDIEDVPVLLIINDKRYGGMAWNYSSGMCYCLVPTTDGPLHWGYPSREAASVTATPWDTHTVTSEERTALGQSNGTWRNTVVHEFGGHCIGKLGDEYWYESTYSEPNDIGAHKWPIPMKLNLSATADIAAVPWAAFFDGEGNLIPALNTAPYNTRVGVFQGGDVSMFYRWRSEKVSCMIDNRPYFSAWQRWLIVNRIMSLAGLPDVTLEAFLAKDVATDPVRDGSPTPLPAGVSSRVKPRQVPMLPPPRYVVTSGPLR